MLMHWLLPKIVLTGHMGYLRHTELLEEVRGDVGVAKASTDRVVVIFLYESFSLADVAAVADGLASLTGCWSAAVNGATATWSG